MLSSAIILSLLGLSCAIPIPFDVSYEVPRSKRSLDSLINSIGNTVGGFVSENVGKVGSSVESEMTRLAGEILPKSQKKEEQLVMMTTTPIMMTTILRESDRREELHHEAPQHVEIAQPTYTMVPTSVPTSSIELESSPSPLLYSSPVEEEDERTPIMVTSEPIVFLTTDLRTGEPILVMPQPTVMVPLETIIHQQQQLPSGVAVRSGSVELMDALPIVMPSQVEQREEETTRVISSEPEFIVAQPQQQPEILVSQPILMPEPIATYSEIVQPQEPVMTVIEQQLPTGERITVALEPVIIVEQQPELPMTTLVEMTPSSETMLTQPLMVPQPVMIVEEQQPQQVLVPIEAGSVSMRSGVNLMDPIVEQRQTRPTVEQYRQEMMKEREMIGELIQPTLISNPLPIESAHVHHHQPIVSPVMIVEQEVLIRDEVARPLSETPAATRREEEEEREEREKQSSTIFVTSSSTSSEEFQRQPEQPEQEPTFIVVPTSAGPVVVLLDTPQSQYQPTEQPMMVMHQMIHPSERMMEVVPMLIQ